MSEPIDLLALYLHLAMVSQRRQRPLVRDRLLVIAGCNAARMGLPRIDAYCRHLILENNPQHAVGYWPDFATALEHEDFALVLRQCQRRYPQEKAESMLAALGIQMENERQAYYSDEEYAAAILGVALDE